MWGPKSWPVWWDWRPTEGRWRNPAGWGQLDYLEHCKLLQGTLSKSPFLKWISHFLTLPFSYKPIVEFIDAQFEAYLQEELKIRRVLHTYHDSRIHACLYFIAPTGHSLKSLDLVTMKKLDSKVWRQGQGQRRGWASWITLSCKVEARFQEVLWPLHPLLYSPSLQKDSASDLAPVSNALFSQPWAIALPWSLLGIGVDINKKAV